VGRRHWRRVVRGRTERGRGCFCIRSMDMAAGVGAGGDDEGHSMRSSNSDEEETERTLDGEGRSGGEVENRWESGLGRGPAGL
jgi:hypothetical protein